MGTQLKRWGPFFAGKLWVAYAVRRWGNLGGSPGQLLGGGPVQSQFAGQSWALGQYVVAGLALWVGGKLARMVNLDVSQFRAGCYDAIFTKLLWTEGIARSPAAKAAFGNIRYNPRTGQKWMSTGRGRYVAMQGFGDELVTASALDGGRAMGDELVTASALDGPRGYGYVNAQGSSTDPFRSAYV